MQRYFVTPEQMTESTVSISGDDVKHIAKVMRMTPGDQVICSDNRERVAKCEITQVNELSIELSILEWMTSETELPIPVTVAQGLPKHDKLEMIVQKGTELGANEFLPFQASRSIVKWDAKKSKKKTERLQKIIKEAAEQSHRNRMPVCKEPVTLKELISHSDAYTIKIVAYEEDAKQNETSNLAELMKNADVQKDRMLIVIGPEGGLSDDEIDLLQNAGFITCGLGPRILRTETAPLYLLSAVSYQLELLR
jgi:16S rRNA (uracil1498-N3)-methyltransferase